MSLGRSRLGLQRLGDSKLTRAITEAGVGGFSPLSIFAAGEKGYIYDNNDITSFFLDSAMTTQATVNGLVGAQRDSSPNGLHRTQATTASKRILRGTPTGANIAASVVPTGGAGWVVAGNTATATTSSAALTFDTPEAAGKVYRVRYTITRSAGSVTPSIGGGSGSARSASGSYEEWITTTTTADLAFTGASFTGTVTIDSVDVRDASADAVTAPYGLQNDGVDDFMVTASADFTGTDALTLCMGVRKLSDAALGMLAELSVNAGTNAGAFYITAPESTGASGNFTWKSRGTLNAAVAASGTILAPTTRVLTGIGDISSDTSIIRVDGVQVGTSAGDQGTGNFGNYPIYFGRRGGASLPLNALDYGGICVGRAVTASELSNIERWAAQRTGVTL